MAQTDTLFLHGAAYRSEMFGWVMNRPRRGKRSVARFLPQHALHTAAVRPRLALASGGVLALAMGAVLMKFMGNYNVGVLAAAKRQHPKIETMILACHPARLSALVCFVAIGVTLAAPLLARLGGFLMDWRGARRLLPVACCGLILDAVMKWLLAPAWQRVCCCASWAGEGRR